MELQKNNCQSEQRSARGSVELRAAYDNDFPLAVNTYNGPVLVTASR